MSKYFNHIILLLSILTLAACVGESEDFTTGNQDELTEDAYSQTPGRRTIITYITGDNNISSSLSADINEMIKGSLSIPSDCRFIVLADIKNQKPYIAHIRNGQMTKVKEYPNDFYTTSPDSMRNVYQWIIDHYPSGEYATVIEGHGSGPIIRTDTIATTTIKMYAYGYDATGEVSATSTSKWMNVPTMANVFNGLKDASGNKLKMAYMFFDCCCFQSVEVAYELRHATEYVIAAASETPGEGADYTKMLPALCVSKELAADSIISVYAKKSDLCISGIKTDQLDALCNATKAALKKINNSTDPLTLNRNNCIYYYKTHAMPVLHDIKHIMKINLEPIGTNDYNEWLQYLDNAIIAKYRPTTGSSSLWTTSLGINFYTFRDNFTDENYSGVSMIAPTSGYTENWYEGNESDVNATMFQLEWCNAVGWHELGW